MRHKEEKGREEGEGKSVFVTQADRQTDRQTADNREQMDR